MKAVDKVNLLSGHDVVKFGGMDLQQKWKMNRKKLSPNYTSNIKEIISINTIEQDDEKEKLKYLFLSKEAVLKYLFLMVGFLLGFPPLLMILKKIVFL